MRSSQSQNPTTGAHQCSGRWWPRALIALVAVLGVMAMHGLTMNHDGSMATMNASAAGLSIGGGSSSHQDVMAANTVGSRVTDSTLLIAADAAAPVRSDVSRFGDAHNTGGMVSGCVAFLTGLLLLFGASRLLARIRRATHTSALSHCATWRATAVERVRPDLAELSVLRT